jgi:hypothetical protein
MELIYGQLDARRIAPLNLGRRSHGDQWHHTATLPLGAD